MAPRCKGCTARSGWSDSIAQNLSPGSTQKWAWNSWTRSVACDTCCRTSTARSISSACFFFAKRHAVCAAQSTKSAPTRAPMTAKATMRDRRWRRARRALFLLLLGGARMSSWTVGFTVEKAGSHETTSNRLSSGQKTQKHEMQDFRRKLCFLRSDV